MEIYCPLCYKHIYVNDFKKQAVCPGCKQEIDVEAGYALEYASYYVSMHCPNKAAKQFERVLQSYPDCKMALEGLDRVHPSRDLNIFDYLSTGIFPLAFWVYFPSLASAPILLAIYVCSICLIAWDKKRQPYTDPENPYEDVDYYLAKCRKDYEISMRAGQVQEDRERRQHLSVTAEVMANEEDPDAIALYFSNRDL